MNAKKLINEIKKLNTYKSFEFNDDDNDIISIDLIKKEEVISVILKFFAENQSNGLKLMIGD